MPGSADFKFTDSSSAIFEQKMLELVRDLENIGGRSVSSAADEARLLAEAREVLASGRRDLAQWTGEDLATDFRTAYHNGTTTVVTKPASDLSLRHRKRLSRNGTAAFNDLEMWTKDRLAYKRSFADRERVAKFIKQSENTLRSGGISPSQKKKIQTDLENARGVLDKIDRSIKGKRTVAGDTPEINYRRRRAGKGDVRGTILSKMPADRHFAMLAQTGHRDITNNAYIMGEMARGREWFLVSDGPDCGWTTHRGGDKANGKVVRASEIVMYSHPHCQRSFMSTPGGPRSKATKDAIARVTGITNTQAFKTAVKAAAIFGQAAGVGGVLAQNPLLRQIVRDVLADTEIALGRFTKKILDDWVNNYVRTEATVLKMRKLEDNPLSRQSLRESTLRDVEQKIINQGVDGADAGRISISRHEAILLNFKTTSPTRGDALRRLEDYADFVRHQQDTARAGLRSVGAAAQDQDVIDRLYGEASAAMRYTWQGRGSQIVSNARRIHDIAVTTLEKSPQRAELELIDTIVRSFEPLPWLRVHLGNFRFSVGMPADVRANLARDLWKEMRGAEFRLAAEPTYAWRTYVPLRQRTISAQDIYDNLTPRITYFGKVLHSTIGLEHGKLVPVFKLYPDATGLNIFSFTTRLRSEKISVILNEARELGEGEWPAFLRRQFKELGAEPAFIIDAFRNGPVSFTARWVGTELDALAIKLRPWGNDFLNYTHDFYRRTESIIPRRLHSITLVPKIDGGYTMRAMTKDVLKTKIFMGFAIARGSIVEAARIMGLSLSHVYREINNWLKVTGKGIREFSKYIEQEAKKVGKDWALQGRTYIDSLVQKADDFLRSIVPQMGEVVDDGLFVTAADTDVNRHLLIETHEVDATPRILEAYDRYVGEDVQRVIQYGRGSGALEQDLHRFFQWWENNPQFWPDGNSTPPTFVTSAWAKDNLLLRNFTDSAEMSWVRTVRNDEVRLIGSGTVAPKNYVIIPTRVISEWDNLDVLMAAQDAGWWNGASNLHNLTTLAHEMGHHWSLGSSWEELSSFWNATFRHPDIIDTWKVEPPDIENIGSILNERDRTAYFFTDFIEDWMEEPGVRQQIAEVVSGYGATNAKELLAELFSEIATAPVPGELARLARAFFGMHGLY